MMHVITSNMLLYSEYLTEILMQFPAELLVIFKEPVLQLHNYFVFDCASGLTIA